MASKVTEDEVSEIFKLIDDKKNFVLNGGAGSGNSVYYIHKCSSS